MTGMPSPSASSMICGRLRAAGLGVGDHDADVAVAHAASSDSSRVAGGTSCPSSTASLKASGVTFSRPAASDQVHRHGLGDEDLCPAWAASISASEASRSAIPRRRTPRRSPRRSSASSGCKAASSSAIASATCAIVCGSYQTCSLKPSTCSWPCVVVLRRRPQRCLRPRRGPRSRAIRARTRRP